MLTFTFAGDEAGDVSFSFDKGASRLFVVAVVATQTPDDLRSRLADVRRAAYLSPTFDFHFNSLASARLRQQVFSALRDAEFEAWAIVVDKTTLPDAFRLMAGIDLYLYFVSELLLQIPAEQCQNATLILDEYGSPKQVRTELRRVMRVRHINPGFRHIFVRRSHSESLIQVADLVAGAILRREVKKDGSSFDTIKAKIQKVVDFGNKNLPR